MNFRHPTPWTSNSLCSSPTPSIHPMCIDEEHIASSSIPADPIDEAPCWMNICAVDPVYWHYLKAHPLSDRELDILKMVVDGNSNAEIAQKLYLTVSTVKTHIRNILIKLQVHDRTQAAVTALRAGLIH